MFKKFPFYPFVFSIFPALSLAAYNIQEIALDVVYRPLIISLLFCVVVFGIIWIFLRDNSRTALLTFLVLLLFFTYGHVYNALEKIDLFEAISYGHVLLLLFAILLAIFMFWIMPNVKQSAMFTIWLDILSIYLLIYPVFTIVSKIIQRRSATYDVLSSTASSQIVINTNQPDVYYIILDAYGREDVLLNTLGYDNSEFIEALTQRGFFVANCSQSNYGYTQFSLPSSLNYDYLENINAIQDSYRMALLKHGAVRSFLEANDYKIVAFPTGWDYTEWHDADMYFDYAHPPVFLTEFEQLVLNTTVIRVVLDMNIATKNTPSEEISGTGEVLRRLRALSVLDNLKKTPALDGKLFIFAHILLPHPPYSFGPNGEWIEFDEKSATYEETRQAYINQVKFINHEILGVIDTILRESETPPIILVQGDHGPPSELSLTYSEKMPILNAYYLPSIEAEEVLYPSISPVNSFRVILNSYFDQKLPLLEDRSYYSDNNDYDYKLVPNSCPE